jgi:hypothetical protein
MTSLAKYAILATIQEQLPLALWHSRYSVGGRVRTTQKPRGSKGKKDLPASSGVRIFVEAIAMLSKW